MTDYIDREAAVKVLCDACGNVACPKGLIPRCSYYERMQMIPAADVRPVVRGKWVLHEDGSATCSNCKTRQKLIYDDDSYQHYCGNCGAQMEVEE